jgi:hypothetical protein
MTRSLLKREDKPFYHEGVKTMMERKRKMIPIKEKRVGRSRYLHR